MSTLSPSDCYCTNLRRSAGKITELYDKAFSDLQITASQYYLLVNLFRAEKSNISNWAVLVGLDRSTMVRNIKVLQTKGWIEPTEGHGKQFRLSDSGVDIVKSAMPIWNEAQNMIELALGKEDAEAIFRIAAKLSGLQLGGNPCKIY